MGYETPILEGPLYLYETPLLVDIDQAGVDVGVDVNISIDVGCMTGGSQAA